MAAKWKRKLRPASFRGVKFFVDTAELQSGRRGVTHEFPDRDDPYREDLGRKARQYPVQGYLVGSEYLAAKDKLLAALEKKGPGDLVHPYWGKKRVNATEVTFSESSGEGGFVKVTITFIEAGEVKFPNAGTDSSFQVGDAASALNAAAGGDFEEKFSLLNAPQYLVDSATDKLNEFADTIDSVTSTLTGSAKAIADLAFAVRNFKAAIKDLVNKPAELRAQMQNAIALLVAAGNPSDVFAAVKGMFTFGKKDAKIPITTSTRQQQQQNQDALNDLITIIAAAAGATQAVDIAYASVDEAIAVRDLLADQFDLLMERTSSDDLYSSLQRARAEVVKAIPPQDQTLARIAEITPPATTSSLALAYELYGAVDQETDLIERNRIRHPGFLKGGVTLETLDRG